MKQDIDFLRHYIFLCIRHATRVKHRILITIYYRMCLLIRVILEQLLWHQVMDHKTWLKQITLVFKITKCGRKILKQFSSVFALYTTLYTAWFLKEASEDTELLHCFGWSFYHNAILTVLL